MKLFTKIPVASFILAATFSALGLLLSPTDASAASLWDPSATPAIPSHVDPQPIEVGVKFKATEAGTISGIRFYKGVQNTGTHVGSLWSSTGQLLARATFTGETASGWQQVTLASPVSITAGTTYVASYHTNVGYYSITRPYFTTQYTNGPLVALADGAQGGNGVYSYGANSVFPTSSFQATNYWVDVVYTSTAPPVPCTNTPIACENAKPGNPKVEWDITGNGTANIQGFATDMSVNRGQTVNFKVKTDSPNYRLDIYRMGYYAAQGARKVASINHVGPQTQPNCLSDAATGLIDCGNWGLSASWLVPADAVSGVYSVKLVRQDNTVGSSQIVFVVRNDASQSNLLFQTSDATWQAYNAFGGNSLYQGSPAGRAYKVSYNRPVTTLRGTNNTFFAAEYPMLRWYESNGYDLSYTSNVDTTRRGQEILDHNTFLSVGHDEYWSAEMRTNVENARAQGVNLAFFSGNEVFWKTRWENSIDGSGTPHRTLVSYKETKANANIDPSPLWTGTWRDGRFSPPADGGKPENALTGTLFTVNGTRIDSLLVPAEFGPLRLWRNTTIASGQAATFPAGTLGYEWDEAVDNGSAPPGLVKLSRTTIDVTPRYLMDYGDTYGGGAGTHSLTFYKHASGARVFGAGTVQWSWGLDSVHDMGSAAPDVRMQQATVNLMADMNAQPGTLRPGLVGATASTDTTAPTTTITSPAPNATVTADTTVTVQGTATDTGGGVVGGVEVSFDGGNRWRHATGRASWQFSWVPTVGGLGSIMVRAVDDSGNIQSVPTSIPINVSGSTACPCKLWTPSDVPAIPSQTDTRAVEVGTKFTTSKSGYITGIRFYKGSLNTGTHLGNLWTSTGKHLARIAFINETASGWQEATFARPVAISPGTTYIASYHTTVGRYSVTSSYFNTSRVRPPLTAPSSGISAGNGVYTYSATPVFPTSTFSATNYWVDPVFNYMTP